jgi:hypothetical protein
MRAEVKKFPTADYSTHIFTTMPARAGSPASPVHLFVVYVKGKHSGHRISSSNSENDLI